MRATHLPLRDKLGRPDKPGDDELILRTARGVGLAGGDAARLKK
jgi:hypothetical protein